MQKIIKRSLLIIWFGVIFYMSAISGDGSGNMSSGLLRELCVLFRVADIDAFVLKYHSLFRKVAHFTEYFILGLLLYINLKDRYKDYRLLLFSILVCVIYASSDEVHQLFVADRNGSLKDVFIDSSGAVCGVFLTHLVDSICCQEKKH